MIDYNGRFCMSSAAAAANRAFGIDRGLPFPLPDVAEADVVLLVGSNPADTMPPAMRWFAAGREREQGRVQLRRRQQAVLRGPLVVGQLVHETDDRLDVAVLDGPDQRSGHPSACRLTWSRHRRSPW